MSRTRLISGRKARGLGSGKSTGAAAAARQRNLKQKFVSLLKKFKVTDPEELDHEQANLDQKLSGKIGTYYNFCLGDENKSVLPTLCDNFGNTCIEYRVTYFLV